MANKFLGPFSLLLAVLFAWLPLWAGSGNKDGPATPASSGDAAVSSVVNAKDDETTMWSYAMDDSGTPVFSQFLTWEGDENVLRYHLVVKTKDATVVELDTPANTQELHLPPGSYEYRITTYNLLDRVEDETDWQGLNIMEAITPEVSETSPRNIYLDDLKEHVTIKGRNLDKDCIITLTNSFTGRVYPGTITQRKETEELQVVFPDDAYNSGTYTLAVENPGKLRAIQKDALLISYQKPLDLLFTAGYAPFIPLFDSWFTQTWPDGLNLLGTRADVSFIFIKDRWGTAGVNLGASFWDLSGGTDESTLTSIFGLGSISGVAKLRITKEFFGEAMAGLGLAYSSHSFDYQGTQGSSLESYDPFARISFSAELVLPYKFILKAGADLTILFLMNHPSGGISPTLSIGYQL